MKIIPRIFIITALFFTIGAGAVAAPILTSTAYATNTSAGSGTTAKTASTKTSAKGTVAAKSAPPNYNGPKPGAPGEIIGGILNSILQLFAWFVAAMGVLVGIAMYHTVLEAGSYINQLGAVRTAWEMFRDLGNIILIFGFIAIGIATILDNASYGAKKALPKLLIVAVMLNFSLFAAEFIVDTGNMFATQFYTQINGGSIPAAGISLSNEPISHILMNSLRLTTVYPSVSKSAPSTGSSNNQQHWFITFMLGIVLFIITAFVLGAIAIMLITRFVILIFLLIVSPIGFIGLAGIPLISSYGKKWWSALTNQTLLAPVLLLFLLVALKLIQSLPLSNSSIAVATQQNNTGDIASILLNFTIVIGLMLAAIIISKTLSGKAASFATKASGMAVFGQLGFAGRHTIGRLSQRGAEGVRGSNWAKKHAFTGRLLSSGLNFGAKSSFDARGGMRSGGFDAGTASGRGGFRGAQEKSIKGHEQYADSLKELTLRERQAREAARGEKTTSKRELETAQNEQKRNTTFMEDRHTAERAGYDTRVADAQAAHEAEKTKPHLEGEAGRIQEENLKKMEEELKKEEELRKEKLEEQEKELADLKDTHTQETTARQQQVAHAGAKISGIEEGAKDRARGYANNITGVLGKHFKSNQIARQNIQDTIGKSGDQKQVDSLLKAIKDVKNTGEASK